MSGFDTPPAGAESFPGARTDEIRLAIARVAAAWGAVPADGEAAARLEFTLPLAAGLRIGAARLQIDIPQSGGRADWQTASIQYRTHRSAVMVLLLGAVGGLALAAWPFFPGLQPMAPLGLVLLVAAWLLVAARVRYRGVEQFWEEVGEEMGRGDSG